jgi:Protein kinase domain/AAA ATPase domain
MPLSSVPPAPPPCSARLVSQRYELLEVVAHGGMGIVYRAIDRLSGTAIALKRILMEPSSRRDLFMAAFEREYQVLSRLDHPRIIRALDYGVDEEGPFYTMELVEGRDLSSLSPMPWAHVCLHLRDIASCLSLLHARRLLHRDLSPRNVKIDGSGRCKLLDFGALGAFGYANLLVGTAPMVPPESVHGEYLDHRADLYSLGALGYWALTGRHAFPAARIDELERVWLDSPQPPSAWVADIPTSLDALIASLLSADVLARPSSAAEVIARLNVIAQLHPEQEADRKRLAYSFLSAPPFVGRDRELSRFASEIKAARSGVGHALLIEAEAGGGRSRLLEEVAIQVQLSGSTLVKADAGRSPQLHGVARELVLELASALPELAADRAKRHHSALRALGREVESRLGLSPVHVAVSASSDSQREGVSGVADWIIEVSRVQPLVLLVDNLERCDPASLAVLLALAARTSQEHLLLVLAERTELRSSRRSMAVLRGRCATLTLNNLRATETGVLARSLFGAVPNVERFAEWLHDTTAGNPLHCIETARHLVAADIIRHEDGLWLLPVSRPSLPVPSGLDGALALRLSELEPAASELARSLSLQRGVATLELCVHLTPAPAQSTSERRALVLLAELVRRDILSVSPTGYGFTSAALQDAVKRNMSAPERERIHSRLGAAYQDMAAGDGELLLEAGWHFMSGAQEVRGAELVAETLARVPATTAMVAAGKSIGPYAEKALAIYRAHRRSPYERLPLLSALSVAAFWENFEYLERYGDEAFELADELAGLHAARALKRWLGGRLAVVLSGIIALVRFLLQPRRERRYSLLDFLQSVLGIFPTLVGAAMLALDSERAQRIAGALEVFRALPVNATARGILDLCVALQELGRENQASAVSALELLSARLSDPRTQRLLPASARKLAIAGTYLARGILGVLRADSARALQAVSALESSGIHLHTLIASQLRYLYHAHRGELALAIEQRARVEVYAARLGSSWQIDLWEPAAMLPLHLATRDIVGMAHTLRRFEELAPVAPSLAFYQSLAQGLLPLIQDTAGPEQLEQTLCVIGTREPRSYIGWTTSMAGVAAGYNRLGRHAKARAICERALAITSEADREWVSLFLEIDLQAAIADAALGDVDRAVERLERLRARFEPSGHPLALGRLHETLARISFRAGRRGAFHHHKRQMDLYLRPTDNPCLIALCESVAELERALDTSRVRHV